jgi:spermidine synthase
MPVNTSIKAVQEGALPDPRQFGTEWLIEVVGPSEFHAHRVRSAFTDVSFGPTQIAVLETVYGRVLVKNDRLQSTQNDEWIYHEALIHPAMIAHSAPRSVLCIGGTTGAIVREVLRHKTVEEVFVFWVDRQIVDALDGKLPYAERKVFSDPRVKGVLSSPLDDATLGGKKFDVIIADPPEPSESGAPEQDVYQHVVRSAAKALARDGIVAIAGGSVHPAAESISTLREAVAVAQLHFQTVSLGTASVPSLGIPWGMLFCSRDRNVTSMDAATVNERLARREVHGLRFYDGETHIGMFSMPKHVRAWLASGETGGTS